MRKCPPCAVYLDAPYPRRAELQVYAKALAFYGLECTSSWLDGGDPKATEEELVTTELVAAREFAIDDWKDIRRSGVFVLFTERVRGLSGDMSRGGCHVEFGIALEQRETKLAIVGPRMNVFHTLPEVTQFRAWADCLAWLRAEKDLNG